MLRLYKLLQMYSLLPSNPSVRYWLANIFCLAHTVLDLKGFAIHIFANILKLSEFTLECGFLVFLEMLEAWLP